MTERLLRQAQIGELTQKGKLTFQVTRGNTLIPIEDAKIQISYGNEDTKVIEEIMTNSSGETENLELPAPPFELSQEPSEIQPYANYDFVITAPGYESVKISQSELLADRTSIQPVSMKPLGAMEENTNETFGEKVSGEKTYLEKIYGEIGESGETQEVTIPPHNLFYDYPPKIPEAEVKPIAETGEIVLSQVVIPEYVVVHNGDPSNKAAKDYYVRYKDYIKNVVSSEIYATWPENTIYANTLVIMSFTLNRVYTEWYRGRGYNFTITNSTAYDQKWIYGRNIYQNISTIVDTIFANYLSRPGVRQPIFTAYCDGRQSSCNGLKQWGSKYLGDEGYTPIEMIRYYYGSDMYINSSTYISGVPSSWPGYNLTIGSRGDKVKQMQQQLNRIAQNYPAIPKVSIDGIYGKNTANAVKEFQRIFKLPQSGIVDYATWYEISNIYVAVSRIAELR